jgi:hypothetical protein
MLSRSSAFIPVIAIVAFVSACASNPEGGSLVNYIGVGSTDVATACGGGYQVFRKPGERRFLVRAYEVSETYRSMCEMHRAPRPASTITGVRYEDAALEYLAKSSDLRSCTLVSGVEITRLHSEFTVACPAAPVAAISAKG